MEEYDKEMIKYSENVSCGVDGLQVLRHIDSNAISMVIDTPEQMFSIVFKADEIWVNGVKKDVDNDWPEVYDALKKFVKGTQI